MENKVEYILMAMFGGGIADWQDIAQTEYDWEEIFDKAKELEYTHYIENLNINNLYCAILNLALEELQKEINNYIKEYENKELKDWEKEDLELLKQIDCTDNTQWQVWCNCLDTHLRFIGNEKIAEALYGNLEFKINRISDKIGFAYVDLGI